jgi:hexokinase
MNDKAIDFLKQHNMAPEQIDMEGCCDIFLEDMERGLVGRDSTLEMIPTYIEIDKEVPTDKQVIVIDAGGTNFRVAVVHFNKGKKAVIENPKIYDMPGADEEVSKEQFFETMAGYVSDIIDKSSEIGFCFSYPTEALPNKDGRLIRFSKEIKAKQVQGQMIGENLNAALASMGHRDKKHIVILNDTVTTLLAGRAASFGRTLDSFIGFILGTGTNCAYIESNKNILKKPELDPAKNQIINTESGNFGKAPRGDIDKQFDQTTKNPGDHTFEKMISGAYLGPLTLMTIKEATQEGLFSAGTNDRLNGIKELTTKDLDDFLRRPTTGVNPLTAAFINHHDNLADIDFVTLLELVETIVERAAKMTAINLSSAAIKSGKGRDPNRPVCIVAEGTTFYKLHNLKSTVEHYLNQYLKEQKGIYYEIISVKNATLIGAAIAGLTN